jgi:hypothetical protein
MIARTETIRASNAGSEATYRDWGVQQKEWLATSDDRTRDCHRVGRAWGQEPVVVGMDDNFTICGESLAYPGDPGGSPANTINCRCTVLPVMPDELDIKPPTDEPVTTTGQPTRSQVPEAQRVREALIEQAQHLQDKADELQRKYEEAQQKAQDIGAKYWPSRLGRGDLSEAELRALRQEMKDWTKKALDYKYQSYNVKDELVRQAVDMLAVENPSSMTVTWSTRSNRARIEHGIAQFEKLVTTGLCDHTPVEVKKAAGRSSAYRDEIRIRSTAGPETTVHEMGHFLEHMNSDVEDAATAFRARRTKGETASWLGDNYRKNEVAKRDKFINPYMGKIYAHGGTEIVSMGLEMMVHDPLTLALEDPEYFDFIFNVARGIFP